MTFHKVVWRRYLGEVENVYITVYQIDSDNTHQIFSEICRVLWTI